MEKDRFLIKPTVVGSRRFVRRPKQCQELRIAHGILVKIDLNDLSPVGEAYSGSNDSGYTPIQRVDRPISAQTEGRGLYKLWTLLV